MAKPIIDRVAVYRNLLRQLLLEIFSGLKLNFEVFIKLIKQLFHSRLMDKSLFTANYASGPGCT